MKLMFMARMCFTFLHKYVANRGVEGVERQGDREGRRRMGVGEEIRETRQIMKFDETEVNG